MIGCPDCAKLTSGDCGKHGHRFINTSMTNLPPLRPLSEEHEQQLRKFALFLAAEFDRAKAGEWRCPMIGMEAATSVVEAIDALLRVSGPREEQQNADGGTSLTAVETFSAVPQHQLPHDEGG